MPVFLARSELSSGSLTLSLYDGDGRAADAHMVTWTVFSHTGAAVSGRDLPAIKCGLGRYYAPWCAVAPSGSHKIVWRVVAHPGATAEEFGEKFLLADPSSYQCPPDGVCHGAGPTPGWSTFLTGSSLGRGDLPLFLKDASGLPVDPYSVSWTVLTESGTVVVPRAAASKAAVGEYFASWHVSVGGGDYYVQWDWTETADSPPESKRMLFSVVNPAAVVYTVRNSCTASGTDGRSGLPVCSSVPSCCVRTCA